MIAIVNLMPVAVQISLDIPEVMIIDKKESKQQSVYLAPRAKSLELPDRVANHSQVAEMVKQKRIKIVICSPGEENKSSETNKKKKANSSSSPNRPGANVNRPGGNTSGNTVKQEGSDQL